MPKELRTTIKTQPWVEIESFYTDLISRGWKLQPMLQLVGHIISSDLSNRLFAYTSLAELVVGIYEPMEWNRESLYIEYDGINLSWSFKFSSTPNAPYEHERTYVSEDGISKLENFIRLLKC